MYDGHGRWRSENTGVRVTPGFTLTLQYKNPEVRVLRFNLGPMFIHVILVFSVKILRYIWEAK